VIDEATTKRALADYGIPVVGEEVVPASDLTSVRTAATTLGFPVALKILDPAIGHKTEAGGVLLGLSSTKELEDAVEALKKRFGSDARLLIQKMVPAGMEWILGVKRTPGFPPAVLCGAGGVLSEFFRDVSIRLCPLDEEDAREMVSATRAGKLLDGWRGSGALDRESLVKTLLRLSDLALDNPRLVELDVNPFILLTEGGLVVDALAVMTEASDT
jgi:acetyltransferase